MADLSRLPPWIATQVESLLSQNGHAWLLSGPSGLGQFELAMAMARAWLCEQSHQHGACGQCASCHAIDVLTHADLAVLMPETTLLELGWPLGEKAQDEIDSKKRKPSKEIRVEAMRETVEFAQRTSARGRGKVVLVFPAERMNLVTANALLKTLEEPVGDVKFVLASDAAHLLLPTIRSRCLGHKMVWPEQAIALSWLVAQGLTATQAAVSLRATGGRVQDALRFAALGDVWKQLPGAVQRGDVAWFKDWTAAQLVDALHKLCHDLHVLKCQSSPRFFDIAELQPLVKGVSWQSLSDWAKSLGKSRRTVEHPFNIGLMQEALISQACTALNSKP
ncbi:MAG: DNA polymerase III subunit delta' [Rhodoferax sp.]|jgi:DNA polymerase-3 subunit delta'|nr:DNA polymerase III subunit delta' [Rhodoferax sp.]